jgi:integrase
MAIEKRKNRHKATYRAYWRNPSTRLIEHGDARDTRKEAERDDDAVKFRLKHDRESFRPSDSPKPGQGFTLSQLAEFYLARTDIADSTRKMEYYHFRIIARTNGLGARYAESLTGDDLAEFEQDQAEKGVKQNTIHRRVGLVRTILNWSSNRLRKYISHNPIQGYSCEKGDFLRLPPPSPTEAIALAACAPEHLKRCIILGYHFGVRIGESELLALKWADFDPDRQRMRVWSALKNKKMPWRDIDIVDDLFPLMLRWWAEDASRGIDHLISYRGRPIKSFKTAWKTCKRKAGITRRIRPYDLRHAFATETLANEADPKAVAEALGHADMSMLRHHYQHVADKQKKKVVQSVPKILSGIHERDTNTPLSTPFLYPDDNYSQ